ncbi:MAG: methyltransferase domain-containing protein [Candidatus Delongbacteria bacterium]|nr:methyltransferase domain-containing protein [Candidatus Delongbacteria bacterium]
MSSDKELFDKISKIYAEKDRYFVSKVARKFQLDQVLSLPNIKNRNTLDVLEIGCGSGANSQYLKPYRSFHGVDFSCELIEFAKRNYSDDKTSFESSDLKNFSSEKKYDIILCIGVIHHLDEIKLVLDNVKLYLKNDGIFLILEPSSSNFIIQFSRYFRKKVDRTYSDQQIYFSRKELSEILNNSHFNLVKIKNQGYFTPPFAQVLLKPKFIFYPILIICIYLDGILFKKNFPFSWNIALLASKKN